MIFQVGPAPNAVSCRLDPTRLGGAPHCSPAVLVGTQLLQAVGTPRVLRRLQDLRFTAATNGIQVDGVVTGSTVQITRVIGPATRAPRIVHRRPQIVPKRITRPSEIRSRVAFEPVFASLTQEAPEARGFVHKRIGKFVARQARKVARGVVGAIPIAGPVIQQFIPQAPAPAIPRRLQLPPPSQFVGGPGTPVQLPPTPDITTPAERSVGPDFQAVQGAFGLAAMAPFAIQRVHLDCPKGMVLGRDNLCYPKQVLRRNSKFRKWRSGPRPPVSAADAKMIRRLGAARAAVERLAKDVDLQTKKKVNPK